MQEICGGGGGGMRGINQKVSEKKGRASRWWCSSDSCEGRSTCRKTLIWQHGSKVSLFRQMGSLSKVLGACILQEGAGTSSSSCFFVYFLLLFCLCFVLALVVVSCLVFIWQQQPRGSVICVVWHQESRCGINQSAQLPQILLMETWMVHVHGHHAHLAWNLI